MKMVTTHEARRDLASLKHERSGQAMLLAILTLGATMLGATTIAGLLMLYQIRQVTNFRDSAQSIFAADAGTEWALYSYFQQTPGVPLPGNNGQLDNGAMVSIECSDDSGVSTDCSDSSSTVEAFSRGSTANTKRSFVVTFSGSPVSLP